MKVNDLLLMLDEIGTEKLKIQMPHGWSGELEGAMFYVSPMGERIVELICTGKMDRRMSRSQLLSLLKSLIQRGSADWQFADIVFEDGNDRIISDGWMVVGGDR